MHEQIPKGDIFSFGVREIDILKTTRLKISLSKKEESTIADFVNDTGRRNLISFQLRRWQLSSEII
ncbi:7330_t:CDS:2 [Funneliformis geosporum]|nr:7330_t:CDS:2 [Funneliformis geosporum]